MDAVLICLLVQEVKHVLDGQGERAAAVHRAEQRLKEVIHKLLQRALMGAAWQLLFFGDGFFFSLFFLVRDILGYACLVVANLGLMLETAVA